MNGYKQVLIESVPSVYYYFSVCQEERSMNIGAVLQLPRVNCIYRSTLFRRESPSLPG